MSSGVRVSLGNAILGLKFSKPGTLRTLHLSLRFFKNLGLDFASLRILKKNFLSLGFSKKNLLSLRFSKKFFFCTRPYWKNFLSLRFLKKKISKPKVFEKTWIPGNRFVLVFRAAACHINSFLLPTAECRLLLSGGAGSLVQCTVLRLLGTWPAACRLPACRSFNLTYSNF